MSTGGPTHLGARLKIQAPRLCYSTSDALSSVH